ncbi:MAG: hypothetical protein ACREOP_01580 [Thermodesulfobacteriota bacterium]
MLKGLGQNLRSSLILIALALAVSNCAGAQKVVTPEIPVPTEAEVYAQAPNCEGPIIDFGVSIPESGPCLDDCLTRIGEAGEKALKCTQDDSAYFEKLYMVLRAKVEAVSKGAK